MVNDYERWDFWNRETDTKEMIIERFYHKLSDQKDLEPEITKLVNDNFFKLVEEDER